MTVRHLALVGPTATGKTGLAVEIARTLGDIELVSVDAMAVYRGMDIGTAKPDAAERHGLRWHLIDVADPAQSFSVAEFQRAAGPAIAEIEDRGHRALLVGGTGLYLRSVVDDLGIPPQFPEVRAELEAEPDSAALHVRLAVLDPVAAGRIEPTNRRRSIRALEVTLGAGRPFSSFGPGLGSHAPTRFRMVGVWLPRAVVGSRIERRYEAQMAEGFLDEVRALAASPLSRTAGQALGYRELFAHVRNEMSLEDALAEAGRRTRAFARRQRVWFRRDPRIRWLGASDNPVAVLPALLRDWSHP